MSQLSVYDEYSRAQAQLATALNSSELRDAVAALTQLLLRKQQEGKCIYVIGNGGSCANAVHLVEDINLCTINRTKSYNTPRFKIFSLMEASAITAWSNDYGYEHALKHQLNSLADNGDVIIAFSVSGNSANIVNAVDSAKIRFQDLTVVTFTGKGGNLNSLSDIVLSVNADDVGMVESAHLFLIHVLISTLRVEMSKLLHFA